MDKIEELLVSIDGKLGAMVALLTAAQGISRPLTPIDLMNNWYDAHDVLTTMHWSKSTLGRRVKDGFVKTKPLKGKIYYRLRGDAF